MTAVAVSEVQNGFGYPVYILFLNSVNHLSPCHMGALKGEVVRGERECLRSQSYRRANHPSFWIHPGGAPSPGTDDGVGGAHVGKDPGKMNLNQQGHSLTHRIEKLRRRLASGPAGAEWLNAALWKLELLFLFFFFFPSFLALFLSFLLSFSIFLPF